MKKSLLFKVISILLPFLILLLFEIGLRIFHYGNNFELFIESSNNKDFLMLNPDASKRYFTNQKIATTGNVELFKKKKDENTVRFFVLGESTTIGYPYFHNGSFHRWLQYRLAHTFPEKDFEIVNLSLTAVNSYTVLGFAKEVVNYEPDAVLIYTGHNEYYGALGVGSTENIGNNPYVVNLILKVRQLRIAQLIINLYEKTVSLLIKNKTGSGGSRMELMVADQQIPYQSFQYKKGVDQFHSNMDQTLKIFSKYKIPVFLSNLVSNEKDLKPFVSFKVDEVKFPEFEVNYNSGLKAFEDKNIQEAYTYFKAADQIYNEHALCNYYLGKIEFDQGNFNQAKEYFSKARDLDGLRFRAPEELNMIISQLCDNYANVHLVDSKSAFETYSNKRIIGNELILEHVHPNLMGYAILSDVFYKSLTKQKILSIDAEREMSFKHLLQTMPITVVDSLAGMYKIANLKKSWPFSEALESDSFKIQSDEEKLAYSLAFRQISWLDAQNNLYDYYINRNELSKAKRVIEGLILEYPKDVELFKEAGMLNGKLGNYNEVIYHFKKAFMLAPSFDIARYLFVVYLQLDKPLDAIPFIDYAINNNTSKFDLRSVKSSTEQVIQLKNEYTKDSIDVSVLNKIANIYFKMDNIEGASKYLKKVFEIDSQNSEAKAMLSRMKRKL